VTAATTPHSTSPALSPAFLRFVGELLFGKRWQTPLAESLGAFRGKKLSPATVHQWSTRTRSIPAWVGEAIAVSLDSAEQDFLRRAKMARSVRERMTPAAGHFSWTSDFTFAPAEPHPHANQGGPGTCRTASVAG
jgi:hypothetical protein